MEFLSNIMLIYFQMEQSMLEELMQSSRHPSKEELLIIYYLSVKGNYPHSGWQDSLEVAEMTDGMGSLLLIPEGQKNKKRLFGKEISEVQFLDDDGMLVSVSLNIDRNGFLFELDVWRVDFGRVISFENLLKNTNHNDETNNSQYDGAAGCDDGRRTEE